MTKNNKIENSSITRKEYKNAVGRETANAVILDFSLRQDVSDEMVSFIFLLKQALTNVETDLKELQARRLNK